MYIQTIQNKLKDHTLSWDQVFDRTQQDEIGKVDIETDTLWMESDGTLTVDGVPGYPLLEEAESQILSRFVPSGATYLKKCPPELKATNVNHWIYEKSGKSYFVRTRETAQGKVVRAILTDRYAKLDNGPLLEEAYTHFRGLYVPVAVDISETSFHLRLVQTEGVDVSQAQVGDLVHSGSHISNSETGMGAVHLLGIIYRLRCKNGLVAPENTDHLNKNHTGTLLDLHRFFQQGLQSIWIATRQLIQGLKHSHGDRFEREKVPALVEYIGHRYQWQAPFVERVGEELLAEDLTKFGLIQVLTHIAQDYRPEERIRLEKQAGELLGSSMAQWADLAALDAQLHPDRYRFSRN